MGSYHVNETHCEDEDFNVGFVLTEVDLRHFVSTVDLKKLLSSSVV